uniref:Fas-binding factor 1 C-terminal domain-containing protein n=1 Tax=Neogobius melanostomus TaxID=47308 RepID=A0A8C6WX91_9GOBI
MNPRYFQTCFHRSDPPQRTRTKVDEIVESLTSPHLLDRPPTGEKKEQPQEKNTVLKDKQDDDLTFGSYQPSVVSMPEGRQSRRQSVRFSTEDVSVLEKKAKPSTPTRQRGSADWLGLKTNDDELLHDAAESKTAMAPAFFLNESEKKDWLSFSSLLFLFAICLPRLLCSLCRARVQLLEESAAQRETRLRQECEDLMERLDALTRSTQQERSEQQAQYQRKLAQAQQERDREVERLRDLQRKSISEMKKDHEDQIRRLKQLKEDEIDAVTSATSQTRSLSGVIEQMEQFSSRLGELSSRVESTHESAAHGLEQGARHRDEQLRIMQDRLGQQQKAMAEEKAYLKEIISRMDTQISEQQRALEKERWKATSEQAKAESTQRSLEEERRSLSMQMNMEREELERAKSALLEEQKSVMQHCAEERRKLAAEWAGFHAQEKQRHDRAEREVSSLLERREGSIISMAQEQADLKLRTAELKQKEIATAQERENLDRLREELDREKERISATALRLKTKAQEVEAFSKLAADKFEEGERTLHQAKLVEAEHEARLRQIHSQTEKLRQQEQRILQIRYSNKQSHYLTRLVPSPKLATMNTLPNTSANPESMALYASLALWKYAAERVWS